MSIWVASSWTSGNTNIKGSRHVAIVGVGAGECIAKNVPCVTEDRTQVPSAEEVRVVRIDIDRDISTGSCHDLHRVGGRGLPPITPRAVPAPVEWIPACTREASFKGVACRKVEERRRIVCRQVQLRLRTSRSSYRDTAQRIAGQIDSDLSCVRG